MPRDSLTGSRIRERRLISGLRQADLAKQIGISASYLNLIEHNRRRIGGKLLLNIARVLGVEPSMLTEGAEAALIATLREAAADAGAVQAETDRADEFAGRFPGWAEVLALGYRRIATLENTVETLSDRLTHDPHLASSLHEVLSTAAAIRSTASILAETGELEAEWRDRFHRNLNVDSRRLAESSKALVRYLDDSESGEARRGVPREEAEALVAARGYHFPELETGAETPEEVVAADRGLASNAARHIARDFLIQYQSDATDLPLAPFSEALGRLGPDPLALAATLGAGIPQVMRRLGAMPEALVPGGVGLVICDASGSVLFRRNVNGFAMPRFGAPCPLWPLYLALSRPLVPVRRRVVQLGRSAAQFDCVAYAWPQGVSGATEDPLYQAGMLILPVAAGDTNESTPREVGSSCRVCPQQGCPARREASILRAEF
ncbi:helix-turn-helix domain-containing protein [Albibacillus kandeliae]|uniref:helix-turn-helix domain-containing protein n=1 Tax=Albibacillus kandeliae TaxID=2174228 RepID=UPI000D68D14A|nr:helix-turn-helix transcriptional regulator [Albibacillus kandeliae]